MSQKILLRSELTKAEKYTALFPQIKSLTVGEQDITANLANIAAALKAAFSWWWVGFYIVKSETLVLGPFQGPVACTRIQKGKGVCGKAWEEKRSILVEDVNLFEGHIACSSASRSEIVVPILKDEKVIGVLDVDSEFEAHFDETDKKMLEQISEFVSTLL